MIKKKKTFICIITKEVNRIVFSIYCSENLYIVKE